MIRCSEHSLVAFFLLFSSVTAHIDSTRNNNRIHFKHLSPSLHSFVGEWVFRLRVVTTLSTLWHVCRAMRSLPDSVVLLMDCRECVVVVMGVVWAEVNRRVPQLLLSWDGFGEVLSCLSLIVSVRIKWEPSACFPCALRLLTFRWEKCLFAVFSQIKPTARVRYVRTNWRQKIFGRRWEPQGRTGFFNGRLELRLCDQSIVLTSDLITKSLHQLEIGISVSPHILRKTRRKRYINGVIRSARREHQALSTRGLFSGWNRESCFTITDVRRRNALPLGDQIE